MLTVPVTLTRVIVKFAPQFSKRVWEHVQVLMVGALLAPGQRTVTAVLRVMGLSQERHFQNYHRVLNRARWSSLATAHVLLELVVRTFVPRGTVVIGLDDTLERRRGQQIKAKGIYRDPVRSSHSHMVKASGLRWLCAMVLAEIPWAGRVWALPFLTALCPSERYHQRCGQRHKPLPQWAGQLIGLLHRWLPGRQVVVVTDSTYAVIELLKQVSDTPDVSLITRLRLDAALYDPAPVRAPGQNGRPRKKGARRPTLQQMLADQQTAWTRLTLTHWYGGEARAVEVCTDTAVWYHSGLPAVAIRWLLIRDPRGEFAPQALVTTQLDHTPAQLLEWFVRRWTMEVTFEEARTHLGIETQRQWSDLAISRTTPALFGLYSLVTLLAQSLPPAQTRRVRTAAWYAKPRPTFSDALALVRRELWSQYHFSRSRTKSEVVEIPRSLLERLTDAVCYAA
jgi:DDE superfamily endonuclease